MRKLHQHLFGFLKDEEGLTAVEYAVVLALVIVVCVTATLTVGTNARKSVTSVRKQVSGLAK